jgi:hypothetical protein
MSTKPMRFTPMPHQGRIDDEISRALDNFFEYAARTVERSDTFIYDAPRTERDLREAADELDDVAHKYEVAKAADPEKAYVYIDSLENAERHFLKGLRNYVSSVGSSRLNVALDVDVGSKVQIARLRQKLDRYERIAFLIQFGGERPYSVRERIEANAAVDFWKRVLDRTIEMWDCRARKFKQREGIK